MRKPKLLLLAASLAFLPLLAQAQATPPSPDALQDSLIASAAADFSANASVSTRIRNVRFVHVDNTDGSKRYLLCGQFQPATQAASPHWTDFATVKTEGYEQWLGGAATSLCNDAIPAAGARDDLTPQLQSMLEIAPGAPG